MAALLLGRKLQAGQLGVQAAFAEQLLVGAHGNDATTLQHDDAIRLLHR